MPGKDAREQAKQNGNRTQQVARQRVVTYNYEVTVEDLAEGMKAMVFRVEAPYMRYDFPVGEDQLKGLIQALQGSDIVVPEILPPFMR